MALEKQNGDLRPFAECVLSVGETLEREWVTASQDLRAGIARNISDVVRLFLRLYEQTKETDKHLHLRCLDVWDRLLEKQVGAVIDLTRELDRL